MASSGIELKLFNYEEFDDIVWDVVKDVSKDMLKDFKNSPYVPEKTGTYKNSLDIKTDKRNKTMIIFENKKKKNNQRLIGHLLEHGVGENNMEAQPHWEKISEEYAPIIHDRIVSEINKQY